MEKKKVNAGKLVLCILVLSLVGAAVITDWGAAWVWIVLDMLFWGASIFAGLFFLSAIVIGIFKMPLNDAPTIQSGEKGVDTSVYVDWEEDEKEKTARRKALRRIKTLQTDYPDMWELMVEPEDEYLCYDYINERKKGKEQEESAGFAAVWTTLNANNHPNGNSGS